MSGVYFGFPTMEAGAVTVTLLAALTRELRVLNALCKELLSAFPREKGWGRHSPEQGQAMAGAAPRRAFRGSLSLPSSPVREQSGHTSTSGFTS